MPMSYEEGVWGLFDPSHFLAGWVGDRDGGLADGHCQFLGWHTCEHTPGRAGTPGPT